MEKWRGKNAVITGASAGIGAQISRDLAKNGVNVIGLARRSEKIEELADELKDADGKIYAVKCDISDMDSLKKAFEWIEEKFSTIHIMINNAANISGKSLLDPAEEATQEFIETINTNFTSIMFTTRESFRLMKKGEDYGIIINISSLLGEHMPFPNMWNVYPATKFAVHSFTELTRHELTVRNEEKIRVTNIAPGVVDTEILRKFTDEEGYEYFTKNNNMLRTQDISDNVLHVLSSPYHVNIARIVVRPICEKF